MQCITFSNVYSLVYKISVSDAIYAIFIYLLVSAAKELAMPEDSLHISMQCITKFSINVCSLSKVSKHGA